MALALTDFTGDWRLRRVIAQAQGPDARFEGVARLVPDGAGLRYCEQGVLVIEGQAPLEAERRTLWRAARGGMIDVLFDDGRPFHRIDPAAALSHDRHLCGRDTYELRHDFSAWPQWELRCRVSGPRKAYTMRTLYTRAGGGAGAAQAAIGTMSRSIE